MKRRPYGRDNPFNLIDPSGLSGILGTGIGPDVGPGILPTPGAVVGAVGDGARWLGQEAGRHYGQLAEGAAAIGCVTILDPLPCLYVTAAATATSEAQNLLSPCPSIPEGLIDLVGATPGLQVAAAGAAGIAAEGAAKTATDVLSGAVGAGAIVGGR